MRGKYSRAGDESAPVSTENSRDVWTLLDAGVAPPRVHGAIIGRLLAIEGPGSGLVEWAGCSAERPVRARTLVPLRPEQAGAEVMLLSTENDPPNPVILGILQANTVNEPVVIRSDQGGRLVLAAEREIVLQCGESSITLTRAGKILIRGAYLLSRSSGVNQIKGGSVQIN